MTTMTSARFFWILLCLAMLALGCVKFDPPPMASIVGLETGTMTTAPDAPVTVHFSESIAKSTLKLKLIRVVIDAEGNLLDEGPNKDLEKFKENTLVAFNGAKQDDPEQSYGATFD